MLKNLVISDRLRNVLIAVALAGVAGMLTLFYVNNYKRHVQQKEENVTALVAVQSIPAGTPGDEVLKRGLVQPRELPQRSVVPGTFSQPADIERLVTTERIYAGEQVTASRFKPQKQGGIRAEIKGTQRAMQIPGNPHQLLAGTLRKGDRVDVVTTLEYKIRDAGGRDIERVATRVVLRDILVLRAPAGGADGSALGGGDDSVNVQLAITDTQAQKLLFVTNRSTWSLALRPPVRAADSPESVEVVDTILGDGLRPLQLALLTEGGIR